ncbi:MAG TPA: hypothetical protein VFQ92_16185 [Blastocatellia bacterium]|nr:hypothetical protein [Blastocatellia bacterium]
MKPNKVKKCGVCEPPSYERNNYFYGKQFTVRDLLQEQSYLNDKRWLLNRMVLGWGVVCGLDVRWDRHRREFIVEPGMAIDCCGHEITVCETQPIAFEQYEEACRCAEEKPEYEGKYVLCLEYDECKTEPVELPPLGCEKQERTEYNRVRDGFKLRIREWDDACPRQPYGHIGCLDRFKLDSRDVKARPPCETETIHQHICYRLKEGCPECECCECVVLATIYVAPRREQHKQETPSQEKHEHGRVEVRVDSCTDRRLVYGNALLYDLIYCHHGDLPHIVDFNWRERTYPDREIDWDTFVQMINEGLTVYFDQEMSDESLNRHTFIVSFLHVDEGTGAFIVKRIPAMEIETGWAGDCYKATFIADKDWIDDELTAKNSQLADGVEVEITLRGSRIWSSKSKALDGEFLADKLPTGNGTQGGDFLDWFRVRARGEEKPKAEAYKDF